MAELLAAITGSHAALPVVTGSEHHERFRRWWKKLREESTTAKRAPPPVEGDVDILVYGVLALAFALSVTL